MPLDSKEETRIDGEYVLAPLPSARKLRDRRGALAGLLRRADLHPLYQCIAFFNSGKIFGHDALIRGADGKALHMPDALLQAAAADSLTYEFESLAAAREIEGWGTLREPGRLFVNVSAAVLVQVVQACGVAALRHRVMAMGVLPRMVVLEITEHELVSDMDWRAKVVEEVRDMGMSLALDDFGDGRSSLRLWSQLKPEFVRSTSISPRTSAAMPTCSRRFRRRSKSAQSSIRVWLPRELKPWKICACCVISAFRTGRDICSACQRTNRLPPSIRSPKAS